ncbi:MAG: hypothetical protein HF976_03250 [ANME-2 cluster archaeon]|nr:hypothetical protein [ANME-2 cluster archaeon]MBC2700419.1 hypothetical protein [ANME-2 cluster archaeon]MBC2709357.1 hypothetical protein [ANME-2 cluster archaeon]MBC2747078.1 hypothetical protein [ANME-2 cluster archaeon]
MNPQPPTVDNEVRALTPMSPQGTIKVPASPQTTGASGSRTGRAPRQSEGESGGRRESRRMYALLKVNKS